MTVSKLVKSDSKEGIFIVPDHEEWQGFSPMQKKLIVEGLRKAYDIYLRTRAQCPPQINETNLVSRLRGIDNDFNALVAADKEYLKELPELRAAGEFFREAFSAMGAENGDNDSSVKVKGAKNIRIYGGKVVIDEG